MKKTIVKTISTLFFISNITSAMDRESQAQVSPFPMLFQPFPRCFPTEPSSRPSEPYQSTFANEHAKSIRMLIGTGPTSPDTLHQWLLWEETENIFIASDDRMRPTDTRKMKVLSINTEEFAPVLINQCDDASPELLNIFIAPNEETVFWPQHPDNTEPTVPFFNYSDVKDKFWNARYTSSRTMAVVGGAGPLHFNVKLPTNRFSPNYRGFRTQKTHGANQVIRSPYRWDLITKIDALLGKSENLMFLGEPFSIFVPNGAGDQPGGFLVRELSALDDEHHYLPAFSIGQQAGRFIASHYTKEYDLGSWVSFWSEYYVKPMGIVSAQLLYRYGLTQVNPHEQQFLIQINKRTLEPTGKIVVRDLADTLFTKGVYEYLGLESYFAREKQAYDKYAPNVACFHLTSATANGQKASPFIGTITQIIERQERERHIYFRNDPTRKALDDRLVLEIGHKFWEEFMASYLTELKKGLPGIEQYFPEELKTHPIKFEFNKYQPDPEILEDIGDESAVANIERMIAGIIYHPKVVKLWKNRRYENLEEAQHQIRILGSKTK
jgi:hypothetical protein